MAAKIAETTCDYDAMASFDDALNDFCCSQQGIYELSSAAHEILHATFFKLLANRLHGGLFPSNL